MALPRAPRAGARELARELLELRPLLHRLSPRRGHAPYEYDRHVHVIDVQGIAGGVAGDSGGEDVLVSNFWALWLGFLGDASAGDVVNAGGGAYSLRTLGDANSGAAFLVYGTGTSPEGFVQYALAGYSGSISTSITAGVLSDRSRVALSGTLPAGAAELGIYQDLYGTDGTTNRTMLARKTGSWSANQSVAYYIDFLMPWVRQAADILAGLLQNANVTVKRIDGAAIAVRTSGDANAAAAYLAVTGDAVSWSPGLYGVPNAVAMTMYGALGLGSRYVRYAFFAGVLAPANDMQVNTIALYQSVYDTSGATQTVCHLVLPLSAPVTLYGGRNNMIVLRVIAF